MSRAALRELVSLISCEPKFHGKTALSPCERKIILMSRAGFTLSEIEEELGLRRREARKTISVVCEKLGLYDR